MKRLKLIKFHSSSELSESLCGTGGSDAAAVIVNAFLQDFWAMHLQAPMHPNVLFLHAILAAARRTIIPAWYKYFFHNFFDSLGY
jgi:hypothetical protein